jgi:hypothetical protein
LSRGLAGLLAAAFVVSLPPTLLLYSLGREFFSAQRMTNLLSKAFIDSGRMESLLVEGMLSSANSPDGEEGDGGPVFLAYLGAGERERLVETMIPPEWARAQLEHILTSLYAWINGETEVPDLTVDIESTRQRLRAGALEEMMTLIVDSLPACTGEQLARMASLTDPSTDEADLDTCLPPEPQRSALIDFATQEFLQPIEALPDRIAIGSDSAEQQPLTPELAALRAPLRAAKLVLQWGWLLPAALLGLIMALAVRSRRDLGRWWGISLIAGGLLTLGLALAPTAALRRWVESRAGPAEVPAVALEAANDLAAGLEQDLRRDLALSASIAALGGAAMFLTLGRSPARAVKETGPKADAPDRPTGMFG